MRSIVLLIFCQIATERFAARVADSEYPPDEIYDALRLLGQAGLIETPSNYYGVDYDKIPVGVWGLSDHGRARLDAVLTLL